MSNMHSFILLILLILWMWELSSPDTQDACQPLPGTSLSFLYLALYDTVAWCTTYYFIPYLAKWFVSSGTSTKNFCANIN